MKLTRRKLTLQLTPLLDLLLIVIFAQYMTMRDQTAQAETEATRRVELARQERAQAAEELARREAEIEQARRRLEEERQTLIARAEQADEQRRIVGELAAQLFQGPQAAADALLRDTAATRTPEETRELREQLRRLGQMQADEVVRHLLIHHELRKRADVWEVHVSDGPRVSEAGLVRLDTGARQFEFRARTAEGFATEFYNRYKALPQPRGMVIILVSYDLISAGLRESVLRGLERAIERMRDDSLRQTRFEAVDLGPLDAGRRAADEPRP